MCEIWFSVGVDSISIAVLLSGFHLISPWLFLEVEGVSDFGLPHVTWCHMHQFSTDSLFGV